MGLITQAIPDYGARVSPWSLHPEQATIGNEHGPMRWWRRKVDQIGREPYFRNGIYIYTYIIYDYICIWYGSLLRLRIWTVPLPMPYVHSWNSAKWILAVLVVEQLGTWISKITGERLDVYLDLLDFANQCQTNIEMKCRYMKRLYSKVLKPIKYMDTDDFANSLAQPTGFRGFHIVWIINDPQK